MNTNTFKPICTSEQADLILSSPAIPVDIRYMVDSIIFPMTLVDYIGDFREHELNKVHRLEAENLFHMINAASIVIGDGDKKATEYLYSYKAVPEIISMINDDSNYDSLTKKTLEFVMLTKFLLARRSSKNELEPDVKFHGDLPKKFLSFRQMKADEWYNKYIDMVLVNTGKLLSKNESKNFALDYLVSNTIWYLNSSQPFKYYAVDSDLNQNRTIARLKVEFLSSMKQGNEYLNKNADI